MKEALEAAQEDLKDGLARLEKFRAEQAERRGAARGRSAPSETRSTSGSPPSRPAAAERRGRRRGQEAERRRAGPRAAGQLRVGIAGRERATPGPGSPDRAGGETRRPLLLNLRVFVAHLSLATKTLDRIQARYKLGSDRQERDLEREAPTEQERAAASDGRSTGTRRPRRRAPGAEGPGRQGRERAGRPAIRRSKSRRTWPTAPRRISPASRSCSMTVRSATSTLCV